MPTKMNRREFIDKVSPWIGVVGTGLSTWQIIGPWLNKLISPPTISDGTRRAAEDLFFLNRGHISIVPASSNPNVRERLLALTKDTTVSSYSDLDKYFSRATIQASEAFKPFLFPSRDREEFEHLVSYEQVQHVIAADTNHTIIALGTPTSNHLIRDMMFYEEMPDSQDGHRYREEFGDLVHLPIKFELLAENIKKGNSRDIWYNSLNIKSGEAKKIPNWGIINQHNNLLLPATINGRLIEDFLVISVIPNLTAPDNIERQVPIVCIGGTHAAGTLAIEKLLQSEDCLTSLKSELERLNRPVFWQAVFRVLLDADGAFRQMHLEKDMVQPVGYDQRNLMAYAENNQRTPN
jgi:hypothetical protein